MLKSPVFGILAYGHPTRNKIDSINTYIFHAANICLFYFKFQIYFTQTTKKIRTYEFMGACGTLFFFTKNLFLKFKMYICGMKSLFNLVHEQPEQRPEIVTRGYCA